ncbi:hypothetical protein [Moellerella wisconsensis]|uniref:hypothetical protein n=1 Tax=Moellerella wisconsensis TaxID=158849 RepID=UPI00307670EC
MSEASNLFGFTIKLKYIIIVLLMLSPLTFADNRPGFVCGKFNGHVMEVPANYIIYWAEYEGASIWNPDFIYNKKGCEANFRVLPMIINWPDMQAGDQEEWWKKKREDKRFDPMMYHQELNLYSVKVTKKSVRSKLADRSSRYFFDENINNYYWAEIDGRIPVVFDCMWLPLKKRYYTCEAMFVMPEIGVFVEVIFTPEKLLQWQEIVSKTQQFLLSKIKH